MYTRNKPHTALTICCKIHHKLPRPINLSINFCHSLALFCVLLLHSIIYSTSIYTYRLLTSLKINCLLCIHNTHLELHGNCIYKPVYLNTTLCIHTRRHKQSNNITYNLAVKLQYAINIIVFFLLPTATWN